MYTFDQLILHKCRSEKVEQDASESESNHSVPDSFSTVVPEAFHEICMDRSALKIEKN